MLPVLADLSRRFFDAENAARPLDATVWGIAGYDAEAGDPSREADAAHAEVLARLAAELSTVDLDALGEADRVTVDLLAARLDHRIAELRTGLDEVSVSAGIAGRFGRMIRWTARAPIDDAEAADAYLSRLAGLGGHLDALARRITVAAGDGRFPVATGVRQAIGQVEAYLDGPPATDPLLRHRTGTGEAWRERAASLVETVVRPAAARYRDVLRDEILPLARGDEHAGLCHVPGGDEGYRVAARVHTTTDATPEDLHRLGLDTIAALREEFAERGGRALGTTDAAEVLKRLRGDPGLRFRSAREIVDTVTAALHRAEQALPDWFHPHERVPCSVRAMPGDEAAGGVLGYYMSASATALVNTHSPELRPRHEYEALAFHETVPGHHLEATVTHALTGLPEFRRYSYITAYSEGWGLYGERLADEMGLYSDEVARLGMVSLDALRACRLVVDTGMHAFGWPRARAVDYLLDNTALTAMDAVSEVDRYIAVPGQALAFVVGRRRIRELRERARTALGPAFDIRDFHGLVLGCGPVTLDVLDGIVDRWITGKGTA